MKAQEKRLRTIEEVKEKVVPILQRYGARRAGVFGSVARGDMRRRSDIDILVELDKELSLLDVVGIQQELEDALGRRVDLVEYGSIKARIRDRVLEKRRQAVS
jgi:predicted nucleotidyltransferase